VVKEMQLSGLRAVHCSAVLCSWLGQRICMHSLTISHLSASASAEAQTQIVATTVGQEIVEPDRSMSRKGDIYIYIYTKALSGDKWESKLKGT